jgi:hypothetical protein
MLKRFNHFGEWSIIVFGLAFFVFLYPLTKPFPYSDDWIYIGPVLESRLTLDFLMSAHNDHRIPIQKALHFFVLGLTGGDFRPLIALNVFCAAVSSYLWILISRRLGSSSPLVEVSIPMYTLAWGFNTVSWAFSFQFVSSFLFSSLAILLWVRNIQSKLNEYWLIFAAIAILAFCGANGLLLSILLGCGVALSLFFADRAAFDKPSNKAAFFAWCFLIVALLLNFESSAASKSSGVSVETYLRFFVGLSGGWLGVFATKLDYIKLVLSAIVVFLPIYFLIGRFNSYGFFYTADLPLATFTLSTVVVLIVVTISRAASQPWWPGLELHYGFLSIGLPVCALVSINRLASGWVKRFLCILFFMVGAFAYSSNYIWRITAAGVEFHNSLRISADLLSGVSEKEIARASVREFYWVSGDEAEKSISDGILLLRRLPFWSQSK